MSDGPKDPPSLDEIKAISKQIAAEAGGTAYMIDELQPPPVRIAGPEEWRLPDRLDERRFQKFTERGPSWVRETPGSMRMLLALDLSPRDITVYGAFPVAPEGEGFHAVMAYQGRYPDPSRAVESFKRIFQAPDVVWQTVHLGQLSVERGTSGEMGPGGTIYLWADAVCVYQVVSSDEANARRLAEAITPFDT